MIYLLLKILFLGNAALAEPSLADSDALFNNQLALAEEAYSIGDCPKAISDYRDLYYHSPEKNFKFLALYRMSFCYLTLGQLNSSALGFAKLLKIDPSNQDVRLRYAQSLLALGSYDLAISHANHIDNKLYYVEKNLILVQALIQTGEQIKAIDLIEQLKLPKEWLPVFEYWRALAWYEKGDWFQARVHFVAARDMSPADLWVRSTSQDWIDIINREFRFVRGNINLGMIWDNNVGQQTVVQLDNGYNAISIAPNSSTYLKDTAVWTSLNMAFVFWNKRYFELTAGFDFSSPFYSKNAPYNNQNYDVFVNAQFRKSSLFSAGVTAKASDSRYNNRYYQDTLSLVPEVNFVPSKNISLHGEIGYSQQITTKFARTISPAGSATMRLNDWLTLLGGFSYSRAHGEVASYNNNSGVPVLESGSSFSRYTSRGGYLGFYFNLPIEINLTTQASRFWTNYEYEPLYYSNGTPLGTSRKDRMTSYYGEISRRFFTNYFYLSLSTTYTENRSSGAQGYPVNYYISNYNYDRLYTKFAATWSF